MTRLECIRYIAWLEKSRDNAVTTETGRKLVARETRDRYNAQIDDLLWLLEDLDRRYPILCGKRGVSYADHVPYCRSCERIHNKATRLRAVAANDADKRRGHAP